MKLSLTPSQFTTVNNYAQQGNYRAGWKYLDSLGDAYADNAYEVTTGDFKDVWGPAYYYMVKNNWNNTAGPGVYEEKFEAVAVDYFKIYVEFIRQNGGGLPNHPQIERAYRTAVTTNGLPPSTAFDGVFTRSLGEAFDLVIPAGNKTILDWPFWLGMERERQGPSDVFNDLDPVQSWYTLLKDMRDTIADLTKDGYQEAADFMQSLFDQVIQTLKDFWKDYKDYLPDWLKDAFEFILSAISPLALDLDGDGVEIRLLPPNWDTSGGRMYFDHDGDGVRSNGAWVKSDDGLLVWDRNGNGQIDNGLELFGNNTKLTSGANAGQKAASGFAALADLDSNADGQMNAQDTNWSDLKVWRDLNQDGISQTDELFALASLGITRIGLSVEALSTNLADGSRLEGQGTFDMNGQQHQYVDAWLAQDTYHRQFTNAVAVSDAISALPNLAGSGAVRDLQEAMMLSPDLTALVQQFMSAGAGEKQLRQALAEQIVIAWGNTSGMTTSYNYRDPVTGQGLDLLFDHVSPEMVDVWGQRMGALEAFYGYHLNSDEVPYSMTFDEVIQSGQAGVVLPFRMLAFADAWSDLSGVVNQQLTLQTYRLLYANPLMDMINLSAGVGSNLIRMDFSEMDAEIARRLGSNPLEGLKSILSVLRHPQAKEFIADYQWQGMSVLKNFLAVHNESNTPGVLAVLSDFLFTQSLDSQRPGWFADESVRLDSLREYTAYTGEIYIGTASGESVVDSANAGNDIYAMAAGNDTVYSGVGDDVLQGDDGDDQLFGQEGNDFLDGGVGEDRLYGGSGRDRLYGRAGNDFLDGGFDVDQYMYDIGDGNDTLVGMDHDELVFGQGISPEMVRLIHAGDDLIVNVGVTSSVTVSRHFGNQVAADSLGSIKFASGEVFDSTQIREKVLVATAGNDVITGFLNTNDLINGLLGDDRLDGLGGKDTLIGGIGNDTLLSGDGEDLLDGGEGQDLLDGGAGADLMIGGSESDTYLVNNVADSVQESVDQSGGQDTIRSTVTFELPVGVEVLILDGSESINASSNDAGGYLIGNSAFNRLSGGAGADTLDGGGSADFLIGGKGDDVYYVDVLKIDSSDVVMADFVVEYPNEGLDTVHTAVNFTLPTNVEMLIMEGAADISAWSNQYGGQLIGNAGNNSLYGAAANDKLDGAAGIDTLKGGLGDDIYIVNYNGISGDSAAGDLEDAVFELASQGTDTVLTNIFSYYLPENVENLVLTGKDGYNATMLGKDGTKFGYGNKLDNHITGREEFDALYGLEGSDTLMGGGGNDSLDGGLGFDSLVGGNGDDTYVVDATVNAQGVLQIDEVVEYSLELSVTAGNDTVETALNNYQLPSNIENLLTFAVQGEGNDLDNEIRGTDIANVLLGGAGNDTLMGFGGADRLEGGGGNDSLIGGAGNDMLVGGADNDVYVWGRGQGMDTVQDTSGTADVLQVQADVSAEQLWFDQLGDDLRIRLIGTSDQVLIKDWYTSTNNQLESIVLADGRDLLNTQVQALVQTMAQPSVSIPAQTTLPSAGGYVSLAQTITNAWAA